MSSRESLQKNLEDPLAPCDSFARRHIGPGTAEQTEMLAALGYDSLDRLLDSAVPGSIRLRRPLNLPAPRSESETLADLRRILGANRICRSFIGMGYSDCLTPGVIQRNILENPGWYTQYTPYQAEISQGRLEALLNFQTLVTDLTGLEIANASLLDEATAAAEAMALCLAAKNPPGPRRFFVSEQCHPQTIAVLQTRAEPLGIDVVIGDHQTFQFDAPVFGLLLQYPATDGSLLDYRPFIAAAHAAGALTVVAADLLSLVLLQPPGEFGADVVVGNSQRFGVPLGFGGPHAAFFATRDAFKRLMPGRLIGVSRDADGRVAYRMSLQTREQHIRREKATSNICTAQVLLAIMASMFAVYHGPEGLRAIARRIHRLAKLLASGLSQIGFAAGHRPFFDTVAIDLGERSADDLIARAEQQSFNLRKLGPHSIAIALDEATTTRDIAALLEIFGSKPHSVDPDTSADSIPAAFRRTSPFLAHPVFNTHHTETAMLRYIRRLESRDLSLTTSMIPLGSCTMKLNATSEMFPVSWPETARIHPFAPPTQTAGYRNMFRELETWLAEITGFAAVSLQPNAGSQGEYAGLLVIRAYYRTRNQPSRDICLIPTSAHGTNPASAAMAGLRVVTIKCDPSGNVDLADLRAKAAEHRDRLAALMITYPSTHGVFEETVGEVCRVIHEHGGQVYMDGANLNAQVGVCRPGDMGADVCHLNLHKTFCIPHGGGGPGMGPIAVAPHLAPYLPSHPLIPCGGPEAIGPISAAPWGSASILPISWVYIAMMGAEGLLQATAVAILNANYIALRLRGYFDVLYTGHAGLVAHECILDLRPWKGRADIEVEDVAKRLMDYGFHAPTMSWPVAGTLMVEPTESESRAELDRFCEAMISIHAEMAAVESGQLDPLDNPLKNAPHPAESLLKDQWDHAYSREQAAYPAPWTRQHKFWPCVARIDNVYGDRNLFCSCAPPSESA